MDRQHHDQHGSATLVSSSNTPSLLSRVSWGAIFAGAVIALGTMFLLGLMGSAIGFRSVDPAAANATGGLGIGAAIWWIITSIIALGIGGYVAGRLSGIPDRKSSSAHGAAVWGVVTLATLYLATSAIGGLLNTATSALGGAARAAGTAATAATNANSPVEVSGQQIQNQAQEVVQDVQQQAQQVNTPEGRQQAAQVAEDAADTIATAAWYAFFASLLSLAAAALAAMRGAPKHTFVVGNEKVETVDGAHRTNT
jgi:hypothetical protein